MHKPFKNKIMTRVYLILGSNISPKLKNLKNAIGLLSEEKYLSVISVSSLYRTSPVGLTEQSYFYNCAVEIDTDINPVDFFSITSNVENYMHRKRTVKWGPRNIDIDIILFGDMIISTRALTIPHAEMLNRKFVVKPMLEINPDLKHPVLKKSIAVLTASTKFENQSVKKIGTFWN